MTEIKFRAWNEGICRIFSAKEMGEDELTINPDGRGFVNVNSTSPKLSQYYPHMIPMQYINESDKIGNDIYVGDIVKYHNPHHEDSFTKYDVYLKVVHVGSGFLQTNDESSPDMWYEWDEVEVVGNIYENTELMEPEYKS